MKELYLKRSNKSTVCLESYRIFDDIIEIIRNPCGVKYSVIREHLYTLLSFNIDIHNFVWYTIRELIPDLSSEKLRNVLFNIYEALLLYNNNYRPIYHLEKIVIILRKHIHESQNDKSSGAELIKFN